MGNMKWIKIQNQNIASELSVDVCKYEGECWLTEFKDK